MSGGARRTVRVSTVRVARGADALAAPDSVVGEEPLELRVRHRPTGTATVGVTMRTPGNDFDLARGFLVAEGVVTNAGQIRSIRYCGGRDAAGRQTYNIVDIDLDDDAPGPRAGRQRTATMTAACGICGSASIDEVDRSSALSPRSNPATFRLEDLLDGVAALTSRQEVFAATGGSHAAALVGIGGVLGHLREDVGRHNAVDKTLGAAWHAGELPFGSAALAVSGRAGFELVQKAAMSGVAALVAVSAPSALAVELALSSSMLLVGFARGDAARVYAGRERLVA